MPFSLHHIEGRLITLSLSTSNVNFDHLLKPTSASFCPVKLLFFFFFVTYRHFMRYFDTRLFI